MKCDKIVFSGHAFRRMFERDIGEDDVIQAIQLGKVIADYPDDSPYPSCLILGNIKGRPLHVVVAKEEDENTCHVVTVYSPDPAIWSEDFKTRRTT